MGEFKKSLIKHSEETYFDKYIANGWVEDSFWNHKGVMHVYQKENTDIVYVCIDFNKKSAQIYVETNYSSHIYDMVVDLSDINLFDYDEVMERLDSYTF